MKNLIKKLLLLALASFFTLISCNEDALETTTPEEAPARVVEYGMGWVPSEESDWADVPDFEVISSKYQNKASANGKNRIINFIETPFDQGNYATSTAVALARAYSVVYRNMTGMPYKNPGLYKEDARIFSPAYLFVTTKKTLKNGSPVYNISNPKEGIKITDASKVLDTAGICVEARYPYPNTETTGKVGIKNPANLTNPAPSGLSVWAKFNRGLLFIKLKQKIEKIKSAIDIQSPVVFGMTIPLIKDTPPLRNGKIHYGKTELIEDYNNSNFTGTDEQAMTIIGYDDTKQAFLVQNSWGKTWGGEGEETPEGCFWLKYDLLNFSYNGTSVLADFCTFEYKSAHLMYAENSFLYDFSGYNYPGTKYPPAILLIGQPFSGTYLPVLNILKGRYIEYAKDVIIPTNAATIEIQLKIKDGYMDTYQNLTNYDLGNRTSREVKKDRVLIFSTLRDRTSESYSGLTPATGGIQLRISENGDLIFRYAYDTFDSTIIEDFSSTPGGNVIEKTISSTGFEFGKWNTLGISYGSDGVWVKINGGSFYGGIEEQIFKAPTSLGGNTQFRVGSNIISWDHWRNRYLLYIDKWTGPVYGFQYGTEILREEGFEGYVKAFRVSKNEKDWVISNYWGGGSR
ncbi:MAG: hypothetical protein LBQ84_06700 [Flavobacteriaceae bacterium]|jgi:hypothetical protein|nr:hypothetical protein [Flavobacteriaceae bacterium]